MSDIVGAKVAREWLDRGVRVTVSSGGSGAQQARRPAHLISRDEVEAWLADSVNKRITYHRTLRLAAEDIRERGVDLSRSQTGAYGLGFYTATARNLFPGDVELELAIRTLRPIVGHADEIGDLVDDLVERLFGRRMSITRDVARAVQQEFIRQGYDGMIIRDAGGDGVDYVVAVRDDSVKVVER